MHGKFQPCEPLVQRKFACGAAISPPERNSVGRLIYDPRVFAVKIRRLAYNSRATGRAARQPSDPAMEPCATAGSGHRLGNIPRLVNEREDTLPVTLAGQGNAEQLYESLHQRKVAPSWTLRNSSGIGEGIHHSVVPGGREFCVSVLTADSEKPSEASDRWPRARAMA